MAHETQWNSETNLISFAQFAAFIAQISCDDFSSTCTINVRLKEVPIEAFSPASHNQLLLSLCYGVGVLFCFLQMRVTFSSK